MNFVISSQVLQRALQSIHQLIGTNSLVPIVENYLFESDGEVLHVTATDNETRATVTLSPTMLSGEGKVAVPPKILLETLKNLPDIPVTFTFDLENLMGELNTGNGIYKMSLYNAENYPVFTELENPRELLIESSVLSQAIIRTLPAVGYDEMRPQMNGVYFEISPQYSNFVSTDSHKLIRYRRLDVKGDNAFSFILHKKPLPLLKNLLSSVDANVIVRFNETNVSFTFDKYFISCRLIEGRYPAYENIIPQDSQYRLVVDREMLISALKRVSVFANQALPEVVFNINGQELLLVAEDFDFSNSARERLTCSYEGDNFRIGFNAKFLLDLLNNMSSEHVLFLFTSPNRAVIIRPEEETDNKEELLMLVMPITLRT
ncbi:MAG: DNA polymerase III subunit beta [Bacteroidales bacterium]|nr:DNA polymerase III subunit beta [Bacteroidales bacterium]